MVLTSSLLRGISALALLITSTHQASIPTQPTKRLDQRKPIWMIAHKCLTRSAVDDAITNGANAVEMDLTAFQQGWWAQHDKAAGWFDAIDVLFDHISAKKDGGANIQWVWLDIKTPDLFTDAQSSEGSIQALQKLVRKHLTPHGVGALYGFMVGKGPAFDHVKGTLAENEGINYDGSAEDKSQNVTPKGAATALDASPRVIESHRVGSYGWDDLSASFGDCTEAGFNTCTELRQAKASNNWNTVLGWTATAQKGDADRVASLFNKAHIDGMIYGDASAIYSDTADHRAAAKEITDWIDGTNGAAKLAGNGDSPWSGPL